MTNFIVAEVSKNWTDDEQSGGDGTDLLCQRFEHVIEFNRQCGYSLHSWQLHRMMTGSEHGKSVMNETIIAVFQITEL